MKTKFVLLGAVAALLSFASCSGNQSKCAANECDSVKVCETEKTFSGSLPAADASAINYKVTFTADGNNCANGSYTLTEASDSIKTETQGTYRIIEKEGKKYVVLTSSDNIAEATTRNFLIDNDSTITLVNSEFRSSENPELNYTLHLQK